MTHQHPPPYRPGPPSQPGPQPYAQPAYGESPYGRSPYGQPAPGYPSPYGSAGYYGPPARRAPADQRPGDRWLRRRARRCRAGARAVRRDRGVGDQPGGAGAVDRGPGGRDPARRRRPRSRERRYRAGRGRPAHLRALGVRLRLRHEHPVDVRHRLDRADVLLRAVLGECSRAGRPGRQLRAGHLHRRRRDRARPLPHRRRAADSLFPFCAAYRKQADGTPIGIPETTNEGPAYITVRASDGLVEFSGDCAWSPAS